MANNTVILPCSCKHLFQDKQYGQGKRVHNAMKADSLKARCSVCGNEKIIK